ncbi:MAG: glycosyltransferase [Patescibacteria group bacterium]|nr:glycosyltransferase [Patescibacteria group bacterium]MDD4611263.1 glycosyltransferase [Patescibacteria group bacterium]
MKIALINNLYEPLNRGGAERVAKIIAEGLKNSGHDVFIITTKPKSQLSIVNQPTGGQSSIYYINSLYYNLNKAPLLFRFFWHLVDMFSWKKYRAVKKILKKEKPNLVITHNLEGTGFLTPRAINSLKIKHIHYLHDIQLLHPSGLMYYGKEKIIDSWRAKIYQKITARLFASPETIISPSRWLLELHEKKGFFKNSQKIILPNPITFSSQEKENSNPEHKIFTFLYAGQMEKNKGVIFLLKTFLKFNNSDCELIFIGNGSQASEAKKIAGGKKNIRFISWPGDEEIKKHIAQSDALIVPSLGYENSPSVIYEAALAGTPVIASRLGGIPELINLFGGFTFEPGNQVDLIRQINYLIKNYKTAKENFAASARKEIKNLEINNYLAKLLNIISSK